MSARFQKFVHLGNVQKSKRKSVHKKFGFIEAKRGFLERRVNQPLNTTEMIPTDSTT